MGMQQLPQVQRQLAKAGVSRARTVYRFKTGDSEPAGVIKSRKLVELAKIIQREQRLALGHW